MDMANPPPEKSQKCITGIRYLSSIQFDLYCTEASSVQANINTYDSLDVLERKFLSKRQLRNC